MRLTRKEKEKIHVQMAKSADRGPTWAGLPSIVMENKNKNKKRIRQQSKKLCRECM